MTDKAVIDTDLIGTAPGVRTFSSCLHLDATILPVPELNGILICCVCVCVCVPVDLVCISDVCGGGWGVCVFRNKTGILGWRSEKTEMVNGYEAKVAHEGQAAAHHCHFRSVALA